MDYFLDNFITKSFIPIGVIALVINFLFNYLSVIFNKLESYGSIGIVGDIIFIMYSVVSFILVKNYFKNNDYIDEVELIKMKTSIDLYDKIYKIIFSLSIVNNFVDSFTSEMSKNEFFWFIVSNGVFLIVIQVTASHVSYKKEMYKFKKIPVDN